ncbi:hypothetical protein McanCB56680_000694 [Microsporum canis]|uniref:Uncharacterized protein n=1 Tax=Arthroderma otae (strain ATCC MYA-4605 / CBS 113480) TaxID=554155 RepID=C5FV45_ARTOC|nr:uncharacterized protein MCYG_06598 [Microsporum canis CBS 113480]EEQ33779.1 predicted protein [Microsporum canis CBS 113480]
MHSLRGLVASALLLFVISCNGQPLHPSHDTGHLRDYQPGRSLADYEAASVLKKVLSQPMHTGDGIRNLVSIAREELAAQEAQNDDQTVMRTDSQLQNTDTEALHQDVKDDSPSVSPSQTSGYSPDASGVIANSRDYDFLPDELNGYAGSSPGWLRLVKESGISTAGSSGRVEFLTPGIIITGVVILLLVTIAFFDFMQWIHLKRSRPRRRPSMAFFIIDGKAIPEIKYSDEDDYGRREMTVP